MYDLISYYGRRGAVIHAISAIDIALWDLRSKALGKSVGELLGKRQRDRVLASQTLPSRSFADPTGGNDFQPRNLLNRLPGRRTGRR
jgi:L-alanine-DL-glutamate epimerase-like enolase superfamily enzyme